MYLTRRLNKLFDDHAAGRVILEEQVRSQLEADFKAVRYGEDGSPVLSTVSPPLRALARCYEMVTADSTEAEPDPRKPLGGERLGELMRELFGLYEEVFVRFTGKVPAKFAADSAGFAPAIRQLAQTRLSRSQSWIKPYNAAVTALVAFYKEHSADLFRAARDLPGFKLCMGGMQGFTASSRAASRSMLLYTDTLLIPDPVARWFEGDREHETHVVPRLMEDVFHLLPLKPLVDARLPYPAVVVFPSFERVLEENDQQTQDAQELMALSFFSHFLDARFEDISEVTEYASLNAEAFLEATSKRRLFVGFGCAPSTPIKEAVKETLDYYEKFRSPKFVSFMRDGGPARVVLNSILERLAPHYHLTENSSQLSASPLYVLPVHWHYATLLGESRAAHWASENREGDEARLAQALLDPELKWLGNVPIDALVSLREHGENETFRKKVADALTELGGLGEEGSAASSQKVERAVSKLLTEHDRTVSELLRKYEKMFAPQAVAGWVTLCAAWMQMMPELTPKAAVAMATTYLGTKAAQQIERRSAGRTLAGVLAASARAKKTP